MYPEKSFQELLEEDKERSKHPLITIPGLLLLFLKLNIIWAAYTYLASVN